MDSRIEKIEEEMLKLSSYVNSHEFQYAKSKKAEEMDAEAAKSKKLILANITPLREQLDTEMKELDNKIRRVEQLRYITEARGCDMYEHYVKESRREM